jgi:hypothetical protein
LLDPATLLGAWQPSGSIWYCHACCSAGSEAPSIAAALFPPPSTLGVMLNGIATLGPMVAPLPRALLGAEKPLRAFIGHVEPTFDWTLRRRASAEPLTADLISALYPRLYERSPRVPVGLSFRDWFARVGTCYAAWNAACDAYDSGARNMDEILYNQLAARDIQSTVILGDPTALLPVA